MRSTQLPPFLRAAHHCIRPTESRPDPPNAGCAPTYSRHSISGSHAPQSRPVSKSCDTVPALNRPICPPAPRRAGHSGGSAWDFSAQVKDDLRTVGICPLRHTAEKIRHTGIHQLFDLIGQFFFQCHTPAVRFVMPPRKFAWAVAGERTAFCQHSASPPLSIYGDYIPLIKRIITPILLTVNEGS